MEVEIVVASEEILREYPEVYHYTDRSGFEGIVKTNSLWATFYADLNDTTEVKLLRQPLCDALEGDFVTALRERARESVTVRRLADQSGGIIATARNGAASLVRAFYEVAFERTGGRNLVDPYIVSLCSHADPYEKANGLLSQWRGYGGDGGYSVIFDTRELANLARLEQAAHYYLVSSIWPVTYARDDIDLRTTFPHLLESCTRLFRDAIARRDYQVDAGGENLVSFLTGVALFKHQGFKEESEVRLIAVPGNAHDVEMVSREHPDHDFGHLKEVHSRRVPSGGQKRFIKLFEGLDRRLPIKRVIVGPSRHQEANAEWAREQVGPSTPVTLSETPYLPPA